MSKVVDLFLELYASINKIKFFLSDNCVIFQNQNHDIQRS